MSALVLAIKGKYTKMIEYLLEEGFDINTKNKVRVLQI